MTTASTPSTRLSVADWVDAALDIIAAEGLRAIKISRLCEQLGVTKGSFYWHFDDLGGFLAAVAQGWADGLDSARREITMLDSLEPRERLSRMATQLVDERMWRLERAMREWARADPRVRAAVTASDEHLMERLRATFRELGFEPREAEVRARALYYSGVGFIHVGGRHGNDDPAAADAPGGDRWQLEELLRIMTTP